MATTMRPQRVLVADDERIIADTIAVILTNNGFETTAVYSGELAVEAARILAPDVLIADVVMAGMNGIEAATLIQGNLPACKVILLSGNPDAGNWLGRSDRYRFEILIKPIHPTVLLDSVASMCQMKSA